MAGQMSVPTIAEIRSQLGMTQTQLAKALGCHPRTILRAEKGLTRPSYLLLQQIMRLSRARLHGKLTQQSLPIHRVNLVRMQLCLTRPGAQWKQWNGQQRACYLAHRTMYRRIVADVEAGRAILMPYSQLARQDQSR